MASQRDPARAANHERWLPVLHTRRGPWRFIALFSNTARGREHTR